MPECMPPSWPESVQHLPPPFEVRASMQVSFGVISPLQLIVTITTSEAMVSSCRNHEFHLVALRGREEHNEMFHEIYRLNDQMRPTACSGDWTGRRGGVESH